jgi:hypothetical protein
MKLGNFELPNIWVKLVLIGGPLIFILMTYSSFNNKEVDLRTEFEMQMKNRTAFYDKMWKIIAQKGKIAVKNDSSFTRNITAIMEARKDGEQVMMKWVKEVNPNANFSEVSKLYAELSRTIESERNSFYERETTLSSIQREHSRFLRRFPNNFYNYFMGRKELEYKPITSDRTDDVIKSGKDNNVDVF